MTYQPGRFRTDDAAFARAPHSHEAEQALLGVMLYEARAVHDLAGAVQPAHFFEPFHQRLFAAIVEAVKDGGQAEPRLLAARFRTDPAFEELGGLTYLADLFDRAPPLTMLRQFQETVVDLAVRREMIRAADEVTASAMADLQHPADSLAVAAEQRFATVAAGAGLQSAWSGGTDLADDLDDLIAGREFARGVPTGLADLDNVLNGVTPGKLIVVGGRAGMGKSAAALALIAGMAQRGYASAMFSLEMDRWELALRMACGLAFDPSLPTHMGRTQNPTFWKVQKKLLNDAETAQLRKAQRQIRDWGGLVSFDDRTGLSAAQIVPAARRLVRQWERDGRKPGAIVVDHLHIVKPERHGSINRVAEVGEVSGALRELAKATGVAVVALCQLSRAVESREVKDKRPNMGDLRWAGEIEQDAYQISLLYRPEYYLKQPEDPDDFSAEAEYREKLAKVKNKLFWVIAKNRNGATGEVETFCDLECSVIRDRNPCAGGGA